MGGPGLVNGKEYNSFDNFHLCNFKSTDGREWTTTEAYYQAMKFVDHAWQEEIRKSSVSNPQHAWIEGQSREHVLIDDFEEKKWDIMARGNWYKFTQNKALGDVLLSTGENPITFTKSCPYWNKANAQILTVIRRKMREAKSGI
jgi:ribA/ribD-fused uncharacterized protein